MDVDLDPDLVHDDSDELVFLRANGHSFEVQSGDVYLSVKGRLRGALKFWNDIHAPRFILDVIEYGYKLPLLQIPPPFTARNNSSALEQPVFVESAINDLRSLSMVASLKCLKLLLSSILCPYLFKNQAKSV